MRDETETREKIIRYEAMLAAVKMTSSMISPRAFEALSQHLPGEAMDLLQLLQGVDDGMIRLPVEDREMFRRAEEHHGCSLRAMLAERIATLRWVLGEERSETGERGG